MLNTIQLFGLVLLGGLTAGELSRRLCQLPRTTGFVVFGLLIGQSGLQWVTNEHLKAAELFIDLALGLILFELGWLVPRLSGDTARRYLRIGLASALGCGGLLLMVFHLLGLAWLNALFAASLCLATSPAITIATSSDVGAKGERSSELFSMVAINGTAAFILLYLLAPFLMDAQNAQEQSHWFRLGYSFGSILGSLLLGGLCSAVVLIGSRYLERQSEHHHLLILGTIVFGVGTATYLDLSVLLPMLTFGLLVKQRDAESRVVAIRIASDARIFLVATFVLAGAVLDIRTLLHYWPEAALIAGMRFLGHFLGLWWQRHQLQLGAQSTLYLAIGLQPMSSVALVLLASMQTLYTAMPQEMAGMLFATILLMQLLGPLSTQTAVKGFGEATKLVKKR